VSEHLRRTSPGG